MSTLQINLPDTLRDFVEAQVASGGYPSASEFIHQLLREAQKRQAWEAAEKLVLEGIDSGAAVPVGGAYWDEKRRQLAERHPEAREP